MGLRSGPTFLVLGPDVIDAAVRGVTDAVRAIAADAVRAEGAEIVDVEYRREPAGWVLRIFIDKQGGVGLNDCQRVSEVVGTLLEVEDPIPHAYTLEVSSPGLTRPLHAPEDWLRAVGGPVKVVTREPVGGRQSMTGRLLRAGPEGICLDVEGTEVEIGYGLIARARCELDWPARAAHDGGREPRRRRKTARRR